MAVSARQKRFFGAVLGRLRAGKKREGDPDVTQAQAKEIATAPIIKKKRRTLLTRGQS